jgi:hypothetical protein
LAAVGGGGRNAASSVGLAGRADFSAGANCGAGTTGVPSEGAALGPGNFSA